jgi:hypothetical protein
MTVKVDVETVVTSALTKYLERAAEVNSNLDQNKVLVAFGGYDVEFFKQDDFTAALLTMPGGKKFVGISKRNKTDNPIPIRGRSLALSRAVKHAVDKLIEEQVRQLTVVK